MKKTINCCTRCENGQAPPEDIVDAMLRHLKAYAEARYPALTKIEERLYWDHAKEPDFNFAIFWDLEDESSSRTSATTAVVETASND